MDLLIGLIPQALMLTMLINGCLSYSLRMLSRYRNKKAAKKFFKKMLANKYCCAPRVMNVDEAKAFPPAFEESQAENIIPISTKFRQQKYLNNIVGRFAGAN